MRNKVNPILKFIQFQRDAHFQYTHAHAEPYHPGVDVLLLGVQVSFFHVSFCLRPLFHIGISIHGLRQIQRIMSKHYHTFFYRVETTQRRILLLNKSLVVKKGKKNTMTKTQNRIFRLNDEICIVIQAETMKRKLVSCNLFMSNDIRYEYSFLSFMAVDDVAVLLIGRRI